MQQPAERFDDVVREYIDLVNHQVGVYMDALAGFAGHYTRVERQVHRVLGPQGRADPKARERVVVWASYEDPARPDVIHNRIVRADDYLAINARGDGNEQQHARSVLVFLFTFWESEIRPRLATAASVPLDGIRSNIMGDLRLLRHAILHSKGVLRSDKHRGLTELAAMFLPDQPIRPSYDDMHRIFVLIKQDCARMMLEWLKVSPEVVGPATLRDVAIQRIRR